MWFRCRAAGSTQQVSRIVRPRRDASTKSHRCWAPERGWCSQRTADTTVAFVLIVSSTESLPLRCCSTCCSFPTPRRWSSLRLDVARFRRPRESGRYSSDHPGHHQPRRDPRPHRPCVAHSHQLRGSGPCCTSVPANLSPARTESSCCRSPRPRCPRFRSVCRPRRGQDPFLRCVRHWVLSLMSRTVRAESHST